MVESLGVLLIVAVLVFVLATSRLALR